MARQKVVQFNFTLSLSSHRPVVEQTRDCGPTRQSCYGWLVGHDRCADISKAEYLYAQEHGFLLG
eukprot:m.224023 g.224023  ORF g.224023 m.224023 type:complete len:65 (+) comp17279_c0_seq5:121-315(+)